ncbi:MAG: hypothetical protein R3C03_22550 [Pirellulaceae bacterium]
MTPDPFFQNGVRFAIALCVVFVVSPLRAQTSGPTDRIAIAESSVQPFDAGETIDQLLTRWVLDAIPNNYTDEKKWGLQEEKHTRLRLRRDPGGKLETYREKNLVNHGEWSKYSVTLRNPEDAFQISLKNIHMQDDGRTGMEIHIAASLDIDGRVAKWNRGVQLYSVGAEGTADVSLVVTCSLATEMDFSSFPPLIQLNPNVESAEVNVDEFRLDHVGKFGGEVAQQVTRVTRKALDEKIVEKEKDLATKLNKKIDDNRDKLRLSASQASQLPWFNEARPHLSQQVQDATKGNLK